MCIRDRYGIIRQLDPDEVLYDSVLKKFPLLKRQTTSFFEPVLKLFRSNEEYYDFFYQTIEEEEVENPDPPQLLLRKVIYFPRDVETRTNLKEDTHLQLSCDQLFFDLHNLVYNFSPSEYSSLAGLYCYITFGRYHDESVDILRLKYKNRLVNCIGAIIPKAVRRTQTNEAWERWILPAWDKATKELEIFADEQTADSETFVDFNTLARLSFINLFNSVELYGAGLYWVQSRGDPVKWGDKTFDFFWLGVRHDGIIFIEPEQKRSFALYSYTEIKDVSLTPHGIQIAFGDSLFQLDNPNPFEIQSLIQFYQNFIKTR
eukprot:TRINITY_DN17717_c0_g1_i1.p1 TRINITY_DN17717_c0_g1~~TRINITY_DN17717_c0_g1_i1.p1  ORF type:complete len:331 (+),score=79.38 TRINITY_DN17717_c0_g1_i1:45-995(+)